MDVLGSRRNLRRAELCLLIGGLSNALVASQHNPDEDNLRRYPFLIVDVELHYFVFKRNIVDHLDKRSDHERFDVILWELDLALGLSVCVSS